MPSHLYITSLYFVCRGTDAAALLDGKAAAPSREGRRAEKKTRKQNEKGGRVVGRAPRKNAEYLRHKRGGQKGETKKGEGWGERRSGEGVKRETQGKKSRGEGSTRAPLALSLSQSLSTGRTAEIGKRVIRVRQTGERGREEREGRARRDEAA